MVYSSRSFVTVIFVPVAPSRSSCARTAATTEGRSPESIRTAPSLPSVSRTAVSTAASMSYVSTSRVVPLPRASSCDRNAASSESCSSVKACAAVPIVGMPHVRPASRLLVAPNPAMYAARAAATAFHSPVRREPISASGRWSAADTMRAAALAIALSALKMLSARVSRTTASAKVPSICRTGEFGKNTSPSRYARMLPVKR